MLKCILNVPNGFIHLYTGTTTPQTAAVPMRLALLSGATNGFVGIMREALDQKLGNFLSGISTQKTGTKCLPDKITQEGGSPHQHAGLQILEDSDAVHRRGIAPVEGNRDSHHCAHGLELGLNLQARRIVVREGLSLSLCRLKAGVH
jgi:hypothetical protein